MAVRGHLLAYLNITAAMARAIIMALFILLHALLSTTEHICWHVESLIDSRTREANPDEKFPCVDNVLWMTDQASRFTWKATMQTICIMHTIFSKLSLGTDVQVPEWIQSAMQYYRDHKQGPTADFNCN